jgi:hypothetical protein
MLVKVAYESKDTSLGEDNLALFNKGKEYHNHALAASGGTSSNLNVPSIMR